MRPRSLSQALLSYAEAQPDGVAIQALETQRSMTREQLVRGSAQAAHILEQFGLRFGDRFLLALDNTDRFVRWFWAGQLLGAVPVPVPPLTTGRRRQRQLEHLSRVAKKSGARLLVMRTREGEQGVPELPCSSDIVPEGTPEARAAQTKPSDLALIQFSSGSTAESGSWRCRCWSIDWRSASPALPRRLRRVAHEGPSVCADDCVSLVRSRLRHGACQRATTLLAR